LLLILAAGCCPAVSPEPQLTRIDGEKLALLFDADHRIESFRQAGHIFPLRRVRRAGPVFKFAEAIQPLNPSYEHGGERKDLASFLSETTTTGLLVVHDDRIVMERYDHCNSARHRNTSMSVAKSIVSALVGIAIDEKQIGSVDDQVTQYLPELEGSGYAKVTLKQLLQMSSGIAFSEDYSDPEADIFRMVRGLAEGQSINQYVATLKSAGPAGRSFHYASVDTQVLAMVVARATNKRLATYLEEKIWSQLGMEADGSWSLDNHGNEVAFAFLNATLRDFAKFGRLFLNRGMWQGKRIISEGWIEASAAPSEPFLELRGHYGSDWDIGYQHQWWIPTGRDGERVAIGVWGQYIYINPKAGVIIVKTSVDPGFDDRDLETIAVFRAIVAALTATQPSP